MIFVTSPRMVVTHLLDGERIRKRLSDDEQEVLFQRETDKCKKMGVAAYINFHNQEIDASFKVKNGRRNCWRPEERTSMRKLCEYFSRILNVREPLTAITISG